MEISPINYNFYYASGDKIHQREPPLLLLPSALLALNHIGASSKQLCISTAERRHTNLGTIQILRNQEIDHFGLTHPPCNQTLLMKQGSFML